MKSLIGATTTLALALAGQPSLAAEPLVWAGCGITKKAFMAELARAYQRETGVEIVLQGGGAAKGIRQANDKTVHLGGTCRIALPDHPQEAGAQLNPVAWDALVVIVHKGNPVQDISLQQLQAVYEGRITNWRELGGADRPLELLVRRGKHSGVGRTLRELIFRDHDKEFASDQVYKSSGPLEKAVEGNPNAIAVTGISSARRRAVRILRLEGRSPTYDNIKNGDYLLYRPLYLAFNSANPRYQEVKRFIDFAHTSKGRDIIRRAGSVPYLEALHLTRRQRQQWLESRSRP